MKDGVQGLLHCGLIILDSRYRTAAASSHGEEMRGGKSKKREAGTSGVLDDEQRKLKLVKKARQTGDLPLKIPSELRGLY